MRATPLPVSMALAGHTKARRERKVIISSTRAQERMEARIWGTLSWKWRPSWPMAWTESVTAATWSRASVIRGGNTG